jgi:signal transduction histidine kinase
MLRSSRVAANDRRQGGVMQESIAERVLAERNQRFLIEASEVLTSSLDYATTLESVAQLAVPFLADLCVIDILYGRTIAPIAVAHIDPDAAELVRDMRRRFPLAIDSAAPVGQVIRSGEAILFETVPDELQRDISQADEQYQILQRLQYRSAMVVPLTARGATIGSIMLVLVTRGRRYDERDLALAREFARRAASAVDNARLYASEQQAREEAEQVAARMGRLLDIASAFSRALTPAEVTEIVIQQALDALDGLAGTIMLLDAAGAVLEMVSAVNYPPVVEERWHRIPMNVRVQGTEAVLTGRPVWLRSREEAVARYPVLSGTPTTEFDAFAAIPLIVDDVPIGVMGLSFATPREFSSEDQTFTVLLAQLGAQALARARLYDAERAARAEAEAAARAREEFLSIAAHELRTPLTTIKGFVQMLARQAREPGFGVEPARTFIASLETQVGRLETLVSDLLDVSRIGQGRLALRPTRCDLVEIAMAVLAQFENAPERQERHRLRLVAPGPVVGIWDDGRIEQVLVNLVSNALKYSEGGDVVVGVTREGDAAVVTVRDEGIGIAPQDQARLFEPFVRSERTVRSVRGTGLGLFISRRIVEAHGGGISVDSRPGEGSTFTVRLPFDGSGEGQAIDTELPRDSSAS